MSFTRALSLVTVLALTSVVTAGCDEATKILDANNSQPGEADGRAVELTSSPARYNAVTADDANIILVQQNGDVFQRARSSAPGEATKLGNFPRPERAYDEAVAFDAEFIYLLNESTGLSRMPRAGGPSEKLDDAYGQSIAVTADSVFYISAKGDAIRRLDKATKAPSDWVTGFTKAIAIALDEKGDKVWIADRDAETISWVPTAPAETPAAATVVASNQAQPLSIGTGPDHVYWSNSSLSDNEAVSDKIYRLKKDGSGQPEAVAPTNGTFVKSPMHADGQFLYFGQRASGIMRVPVGGGTSTKFLNVCEHGFAVVGEGVYVVENNGNRFSEEERTKPNRVMTATK
jgi:hypothetical protein